MNRRCMDAFYFVLDCDYWWGCPRNAWE